MAGRRINATLLIGIIVLAVGIVLFSVSITLIAEPASPSDASMHLLAHGKYVSRNITVGSDSVLIVTPPHSLGNYYLVPSQYLPSVNYSGVMNYSIAPASGNQATIGNYTYQTDQNSSLFYGLNGSYALVSFSSPPPSLTYMIEGPGLLLSIFATVFTIVLYWIVILAGVVLVIVGGVLEYTGRRRLKDSGDQGFQ